MIITTRKLKIMKKPNNIIRFGCLVLLVFQLSCSEHLELNPISSITTNSFWKTKEDAQGALNGMYVSLRGVAVTLYRSEIRSEVYEGGIAGTGGDFADIQANALTAANPGHPGWIGYYRVINDANLLLKYVPNISFASEAEKNQILAEAHAMRAYIYFIMTKTWGDLILRDQPVESSSPDVTVKSRSPQVEVFSFIKKDIDDALALFPNNNFPAGRIKWSTAATNALKADVYLWTGKRLNGGEADFNTALAATLEVDKSDTQLLPDFGDIFKYENKGNKELLMAVRHDVIEGGLFLHYTWFGSGLPSNVDQATRDLVLPTGQGQGLLVPTQLVRDQFLSDDARRSATFHEIYTENEAGTRTYFSSVNLKFSGVIQAGNRIFTNDAILYRYADVVLMRAEAKSALNQDPSQDVNAIRQRAFGDNFNAHAFVNGTRAQNDDAILKERLLELMFEGKRWEDLVRFGKVFDIVPNLKSRSGSDYLLLFPISLGTLSIEPLVRQNPGYEQ